MGGVFPQRKSPRLIGYDYTLAGAYFVTICSHERTHLFGQVQADTMVLNIAGEIAAARWLALPEHHFGIELDAFVVMPNHVHGIIVLVGTTQASSGVASSGTTTPADRVSKTAGRAPTSSGSLGAVVGSYKSGVTRRIRESRNDPALQIWQGRYHDHIIRSESALVKIQRYVTNNPAQWQEDTFFAP